MAERRMFARSIIDSDLFLDMPMSSQLLYFHLSMRADDDGFVNSPKKIQKIVNCSTDDMKLLIAKNFILPFESGVVVIKHWKVHNFIRNDRYKETECKEEKNQLQLVDNKYEFNVGIPNDNQMSYQRYPQVSLGKDSIELGEDKDSIDKVKKEKKKSVKSNDIDDIISIFNEFSNGNEELKETLISFMEMRKEKRLPLTTRAVKTLVSKLKKIAKDEDEMIEILNNSILSSWQGIFPLNNKQQKYVKEDIIPEHHLKGYEEPSNNVEIDRSELIRKIKGEVK